MKRFFIGTALILVAAVAASAQGVRYDNQLLSARGLPVAGANVAVCTIAASTATTPCSPTISIWSDRAETVTLANPTTTSGLGNYGFFASPGSYLVQIYGAGLTTQVYTITLPCDPSATVACTVSAVPTLPAQTANTVLAGPASGAAAAPAFRAAVSADIPAANLAASGNGGVTGTLPIGNGGCNATTAVGCLANLNGAGKPATADALQFVTAGGSDTNDGLSWSTAKLTVAAACAALPSGNSLCTTGTGAVFVSPAFTGTIPTVSPGGTVQVVALTPLAMRFFSGGGTFTNTGTASNGQFLMGSISPLANFQIFHGAGQGDTEALQGGVTIPSTSTINQVDAVGGWVDNNSTTTNGVGLSGSCQTVLDGTKCWGAGIGAQNKAGQTNSGIIAAEFDTLDYAGLGGRGIALDLIGPTGKGGAPSGSYAVEIIADPTKETWNSGIFFDTGAVRWSGNAIQLGALATAISTQNYGAPTVGWHETYWNGTASADESYGINTTNPTTNSDDIDITHAGGPAAQFHYFILGSGILSFITPETFASLPACTASGVIVPVTNSTTKTWGATITGGGTFPVLAFCDGTNWVVAAASNATPPTLSGSVAGSITALAANSCGDVVTATVTGATTSMVATASPQAAISAGLVLSTPFVSAANTVTAGYCNVTTASITPAAATFNIRVIQ